jgi:hypothetical protein
MCFAKFVDTKEVWKEIYENIKEDRMFSYSPKYSDDHTVLSFDNKGITIFATYLYDEMESYMKVFVSYDLCKNQLLKLLENLIT